MGAILTQTTAEAKESVVATGTVMCFVPSVFVMLMLWK